MALWPWTLLAALLAFSLGLSIATRRRGAEHVDRWLFTHRDHLPIPFLLVWIATWVVSDRSLHGARSPWLGPLGVALIVLGEGVRIWAVGSAGAATRSKSTHAKRLVQEGPYAIIRNPIYAGNFALCIGISCLTQSWAAIAACALYFVIVYGRIIRAEERFLHGAFGASYERFVKRVPRIVPRLGFSWEAVRAPVALRELRKEYWTLLGIACMVVVLHVVTLAPWQGWRARDPSRGFPRSVSLDGTPGQAARVITVTPAHALGRQPATSRTVPEGWWSAPAELPADRVGRPALGYRLLGWSKRQLPSTIVGAMAFAGSFFSVADMNRQELHHREFEELVPTIAGATLVALTAKTVVSQALRPQITAFEPTGRESSAWSITPYVSVGGDGTIGVQVERKF